MDPGRLDMPAPAHENARLSGVGRKPYQSGCGILREPGFRRPRLSAF